MKNKYINVAILLNLVILNLMFGFFLIQNQKVNNKNNEKQVKKVEVKTAKKIETKFKKSEPIIKPMILLPEKENR